MVFFVMCDVCLGGWMDIMDKGNEFERVIFVGAVYAVYCVWLSR